MHSTLIEFTDFSELNNWSVAHLLENLFEYNHEFELVKIDKFLKRNKTQVLVEDDVVYKRVKIKLYNKGIVLRDTEVGKNIGTKKQFRANKGQFLLSKIDARNGAFGIATKEVDNAIITADFFAYDIDEAKIVPYFLVLLTTTKQFQKFAQSASSGTTGRQRINENKFLNVKIPLPSLKLQKQLVNSYLKRIKTAEQHSEKILTNEIKIEELIYNKLHVKEFGEISDSLFELSSFRDISSWSYRDVIGSIKLNSDKFDTVKLKNKEDLFLDLFRGKSPKYKEKSKNYILNQKCNRWNAIELEHTKSVDESWYSNIDRKFFTQKGDILINSTGDGTIGRASLITDNLEGLIYDSHILLLRVNPVYIHPLFLVYFINSSLGQTQIENIKSAIATKQTELGINNLKNLQLLIPSPDVQGEIIQRILDIKREMSESTIIAERNKKLAVIDFEKEIFSET
jgi:type I restriction enzyme S subunit